MWFLALILWWKYYSSLLQVSEESLYPDMPAKPIYCRCENSDNSLGERCMAIKRGFKYYEKFIRGSSLHLLHSLHSIIID
jgi:hypothetical protein